MRGRIPSPKRKRKYQKSRYRVDKKEISWDSEHMWTPLLEHSYSDVFNKCCDAYPHYLDAVMDGLEVFQVGEITNKIGNKIGCYTAVDDDLFLPKGIYKADEGVPIIFDSGCTHAVTPYEEDFVGTIKPISKVMNGLGAQAKIIGEGTVLWKFRDDFGVSRRVKVKAYLVPASKVRLFSPQAYFHASKGGRFSMNIQGSVSEFAKGGTLTFE